MPALRSTRTSRSAEEQKEPSSQKLGEVKMEDGAGLEAEGEAEETNDDVTVVEGDEQGGGPGGDEGAEPGAEALLEAEGDEEEVTRCICGQQDPPEDSGLYIQCEKCHVWQHGFCVGIEEDVPEMYWCERCKPELHVIVVTPDGKRSQYQGLSQKRKSRRAQKTEKQDKQDKQEKQVTQDKVKKEVTGRRRERSTLNSIEDAKYEALIQRVMEESKRDAQTDGSVSSPSATAAAASTATTGSSRRKRSAESLNGEEAEEADGESHEPEERDAKTEGYDSEKSKKSKSKSKSKGKGSQQDAKSEENGEESDSKAGLEESALSESNDSSSTKTGGNTSNNNSSVSTANSRKKSKKSKAKPSASGTTNGSSSDKNIDFNKPTKPRLPQSRTTMNEMRKRVAAILEFIGRTQIDIANEQDNHNNLVKFIENDKEKDEKFSKIFNNYNSSLELMDKLTHKLLIWEQKFGKFGDK